MILSSGEVGIADKMEEGGGKVKAGQLVRAIDIDANIGEYGVFNELHGLTSSAELADLLNRNTNKYYGVVAEVFIRKLIEEGASEIGLTNNVRDTFVREKQRIRKKFDLEKAHGQVLRVADVFALVGTAGIFAVELGVFKYIKHKDIQKYIDFVFGRWLSERGKGAMEERDIVEQLEGFLMENKARFQDLDSDFSDSKIFDMLGYKRKNPTQEEIYNELELPKYEIYYFIPRAFREKFCLKLGLSPKTVRKFLKDKGILQTEEGTGVDKKVILSPFEKKAQAYDYDCFEGR